MEPAIWTSVYVELQPEEALRRLRALGWRHFELSCEHLQVLVECSRRPARVRRFRQLCEELGVRAPQCHLPLMTNFAQGDYAKRQEQIEAALEWIAVAADLGIKNGVLHPGGGDGLPNEAAWQEVKRLNLDAFAQFAAKAESLGFRVAIENMADGAGIAKRGYGSVVWELLEIIHTIGSPALGICLDTSHANLQRLDLPAAFRECGEHLSATHISDNDGSGDQHRIPGHGKIDWPPVMAAVREIGYDGVWNLEIPGERLGPEPWVTARMKYALQVAKAMLKLEFCG
ncbi:MAG: hypothetical protein COZ06_34990 [Armatimonadetes bacterium CG_4_10_14_3_um_filter_66_18]|nr:sugar phosphate isomerase/epimerase [Armatimonadota bacterium]OIP11537.1 MAG: hypothetical protein AUJ96_02130 [Armatimonadetes bacterium CG2_30_66_41]PIU90060.1 MAG: hypothetical protein COS65_26425 [Armatimonadetes bacterium CG06_land_8_20_14_3_00_66_21]PIX39991.1 MAG: hypothetical protein COZ57_27035 [Armatimonadetes bacterium CG_4_8_14_3_um_filter_66_20]PIY36721.1 MAG: hypothetical protein COZ06_34990 [Armatimonadetes bacterium CG_4_10_14_3_um_filter_66_18]PIZ48837.1 MAG: hypothetical p